MSPNNMITRSSSVLSVLAGRTAKIDSVPLANPSFRSLYTSSVMAHSLVVDNINPNVIKLEYAVRGPLVQRAQEIRKELSKGMSKPFKHVIAANIGDAHATGQKPITFIRQVIACATNPALLKCGNYPNDVRERAKELLADCGGQSLGAYTMSQGLELVRRHVAEYIEKRDGHKTIYTNVFLSTGATSGIKSVLQLFSCTKINGKNTGVMIPVPQYPLYTATIAEYGLDAVPYYLDEDANWGLNMDELEDAYCKAKESCEVRAIVVINPGNPTGQVLSKKNIEDVIMFAIKHKLFILADEVYQDNVYGDNKFYSFKKVACDMEEKAKGVEMASFCSASKGYTGECGLRGGWCELFNMNPEVQAQLYKTMSASLCSSSIGQLVIDCIAKPPDECDQSYELWREEKTAILKSLAVRAKMITEIFNTMEGFKCNPIQGALYAFPSIQLPPKAIEAAKAANQTPDLFYCFHLLEETGICIVPGSGFGQKPGTYHFRTTILPQEPLLKEMLQKFQTFHEDFTKRFS